MSCYQTIVGWLSALHFCLKRSTTFYLYVLVSANHIHERLHSKIQTVCSLVTDKDFISLMLSAHVLFAVLLISEPFFFVGFFSLQRSSLPLTYQTKTGLIFSPSVMSHFHIWDNWASSLLLLSFTSLFSCMVLWICIFLPLCIQIDSQMKAHNFVHLEPWPFLVELLGEDSRHAPAEGRQDGDMQSSLSPCWVIWNGWYICWFHVGQTPKVRQMFVLDICHPWRICLRENIPSLHICLCWWRLVSVYIWYENMYQQLSEITIIIIIIMFHMERCSIFHI